MSGLIETETETVLQCWRKRGPQKFGFTSLKGQCITIINQGIVGCIWLPYKMVELLILTIKKENELVERKTSIDSVKI